MTPASSPPTFQRPGPRGCDARAACKGLQGARIMRSRQRSRRPVEGARCHLGLTTPVVAGKGSGRCTAAARPPGRDPCHFQQSPSPDFPHSARNWRTMSSSRHPSAALGERDGPAVPGFNRNARPAGTASRAPHGRGRHKPLIWAPEGLLILRSHDGPDLYSKRPLTWGAAQANGGEMTGSHR